MPERGDAPAQKESDNTSTSMINDVSAKLLREVEVLGGGLGRSVQDAWNNPGESLKKVGIAGAFGAGLAFLQPQAGLARVGVQVFGASMMYHFATDASHKLRMTGTAMADTWSSADNLERNKDIIAASLGQLAVDTTLMTAGGLAGARAARSVHIGYDTWRMGRIAERELAKLEAFHPESAIHSRRVAAMSVETGRQMGIRGLELQKLKYGALLHDIGKLDTPMHILGKQGPLTEAEYAIMKQHAAHSGTRIDNMKIPSRYRDISYIARQHHETLDGTGYPLGLTGDKIHPHAKIVTVNDVHDAMSSTRGYKPRLDIAHISRIMNERAGVHFDQAAFNAHMSMDAGFMVKTMDMGVGRSTASTLRLFSGRTWGETLKILTQETSTPNYGQIQKAWDAVYNGPKPTGG